MSKITFPRKPDIKPKHALFKFGTLSDTGRSVQIEGELPRHVLSEVERMLWLPEPIYLLVAVRSDGVSVPTFCHDIAELEYAYAKTFDIDRSDEAGARIVTQSVADLLEEEFGDNGNICVHLYTLKVAE